MRNKPKILVVGSLVMDLTTRTEKFPGSGETVFGNGFCTAPGGKGANQAVQAARLGADVTMVGMVGNDDFGRQLIASCKAAGIHTEKIAVDVGPSAVGNVLLEIDKHKATKNRIIVVPGANMSIAPEDVAFLKEDVARYDMVVLQQEIPMQINEIVAEYAAEKGVPVMLNPAPSAMPSQNMLSHLAYISPNEHEAAGLTGITIRKDGKSAHMDDVKSSVDSLLSMGIGNVVITMGNAGAVVANRSSFLYRPCVDVVEVKDPTAAGDSFIGAFTTGIGIGLKLQEALDFANYTATITVSRMGAQPSLPTLDEVIALMKQEHCPDFDFSCLDALK
jgi:ribokinase